MSKSRTRRASRKPIYLILAISLVLAISYVSFRTYFTPQLTQIMAITPIELVYGDTTIQGSLQKDNTRNVFVLILPDLRVVTLDVKGIDKLIALPVTVSGNLSTDLTMKVNQINLQSL